MPLLLNYFRFFSALDSLSVASETGEMLNVVGESWNKFTDLGGSWSSSTVLGGVLGVSWGELEGPGAP